MVGKEATRNGDLLALLKTKVLPSVGLLDLNQFDSEQPRALTSKALMQLCLGYLKLSSLDPAIKDYLCAMVHLPKVVEYWMTRDSPSENEAARVLVFFLSKLAIPNAVLAEWLTAKHWVFQRTSDLLLAYITENWEHPELRVAQYLVAKAQQTP